MLMTVIRWRLQSRDLKLIKYIFRYYCFPRLVQYWKLHFFSVFSFSLTIGTLQTQIRVISDSLSFICTEEQIQNSFEFKALPLDSHVDVKSLFTLKESIVHDWSDFTTIERVKLAQSPAL